jgi:uncharacterized protein YkwD
MRSTPRLFVSLALGGTLLTPLMLLVPSAGADTVTTTPEEPQTLSRPAAGTTEERRFIEFVNLEQATRPQATDEERQFVDLVNRERARRGLRKLEIEPLLTAIARQHSTEMRDRSYFNHDSPIPVIRTPMDRYRRMVPNPPNDYACVGENLFYCTVVDIQRGHRAFMNSPTHRDNVVFPHYQKIGVGIVKNDRGEFWVTQMYLTNTDYKRVAKRVTSRK